MILKCPHLFMAGIVVGLLISTVLNTYRNTRTVTTPPILQDTAELWPVIDTSSLTIDILYHAEPEYADIRAVRNGFVASDEADAILFNLIKQLQAEMDSIVTQTPWDRLEMEQRILQKAREGARDGVGGGKEAGLETLRKNPGLAKAEQEL